MELNTENPTEFQRGWNSDETDTNVKEEGKDKAIPIPDEGKKVEVKLEEKKAEASEADKKEPTQEEEKKKEELPAVEVKATTPKAEDENSYTFKKKWQLADQRHKSLDGMIKSEKERNKQLEQELAKLKTEQVKEIPQEKKEALSSEDEFAELDKLVDDYGDQLPLAVKTNLKRMKGDFEAKLKAVTDAVSSLEPIKEIVLQKNAAEHYDGIKKAHPDFKQYNDSGEIKNWIDSLPVYKRNSYDWVYKNGSTEDVIDMLTDFKAAMGYADLEVEPKDESDKAVEVKKEVKHNMATKTKTTPISPVGRKTASFEDGWNSA